MKCGERALLLRDKDLRGRRYAKTVYHAAVVGNEACRGYPLQDRECSRAAEISCDRPSGDQLLR